MVVVRDVMVAVRFVLVALPSYLDRICRIWDRDIIAVFDRISRRIFRSCVH